VKAGARGNGRLVAAEVRRRTGRNPPPHVGGYGSSPVIAPPRGPWPSLALLVVLTFVLCATLAAAPRPMEIEDLFRFQRVEDPQVSPDGRWVVFVVGRADKAENRWNSDLWLVPLAGGEPRQLTNGPRHDRHPRWSPDGKRVVFESNRSGTFQLYTIRMDGGEAQQLTTLSTEATQPVWSPDGRHIAFVSAVFPEFSDRPFKESDALNQKQLEEREQSKVKARVFTQLYFRHWDSWVEGKRQHLFVVPVKDGLAAGDPLNLTPGDRDAIPTSSTFSAGDDFAFSPDGLELAYTATPVPTREEAWNANHDLYTVNLATGERRQITTNPAADGFPRYSPDGRFLAYRAQERAGFEADRWQLVLLERATGMRRSVTSTFDSSVEAFTWGPDSQALYFEAEEQGGKPLWRATVEGGAVQRVVAGGVNGDVRVTPDGQQLVFARATLVRPAELFTADIGGRGVSPATRVNEELAATLLSRAPESVSYTGAGGTPIQMWLVKPPGFDAARQHPLVYWVHGGPQGAWQDGWSYRWNAQLWAAQGYVLALPNPRGSTGFGQKFVDEISGDWGGKCFEDLMAGLAWLERQPYVNTNRMAAAGASFGGYMMNWFQGQTNKFKCLVNHCGVYNFVNMYGATDELWFDEWDHGIPWENAEFEKWSPHRFAGKFQTPTLVIHGELDFRIPVTEGINTFATLQRRGVPSKFLYFPDEGHWILKPQNSELWHRTVFEWLAEYLGR